MRWIMLLGLSASMMGCGANQMSPVLESGDDIDPGGRAALQMYLVLTDKPSAMQTPGDVAMMWKAVHGELSEFQSLRGMVRWAPANYKIDVELDFADLPHAALPRARLAPLLRRLPDTEIQRAGKARLAVSIRSASTTLPDGEHIRLVGAAVLHIAERYDGVIIDLLAQRAWTPKAWREELLSSRLSSRQTRLVTGRLTAGGHRLRSRGHLKYGLPDLELDVSEGWLRQGKVMLGQAQMSLIRTGRIGLEAATPCVGKGYDGQCIRLRVPQRVD